MASSTHVSGLSGLSGKSGKCSNFGNCSIADARTPVDVPSGMDFVCTECGKTLLLTDSGGKSGNSKALVVGLLLLVLLLAAGGIAWSLFSGKKNPEVVTAPAVPAAKVAPPPVAETPRSQPQVEAPARPLSGTCSAADEKVGLCRTGR